MRYRQDYGGPPIDLVRPEPVRVRPTTPAPSISGKRTTLGDLIDRALIRMMTRGIMPGYGTRDNRKPRDPAKIALRIARKERQKARRKAYLEGVMRVEIQNE